MLFEIPVPVLQTFLSAYSINLVIAVLAMAIGCPFGFLFGYLSGYSNKALQWLLMSLRSLFCNVPSFVLLFYFTLIVPSQFEFMGGLWSVSPFAKAVLALSIPVVGYYSAVFEQVLQGKAHFSMATFKQFFIVILMASTTASVIGVPEIMAVANTYIASQGDTSIMLMVYMAVVLIFIVSGLVIQFLFFIFNRLYCLISGNKYSKDEPEEEENNAVNPSA